MDKFLLDTKLAHLSDADVESLINKYYKGGKFTTLIPEFNIQCTPQSLSKLLLIILDEDKKCPLCNEPMGLRVVLRANNRKAQNALQCVQCEHTDAKNCLCAYCREMEYQSELEKVQAKKLIIKEYCNQFHRKLTLQEAENADFRTAVYLLAFVRASEINSDGTYSLMENNLVPFAPKGDLHNELLLSLIYQKLIKPSANSNPKAFIVEASKVVSLELQLINWELNCKNIEQLIYQFESFALNNNWPDCWSEKDVADLRLELALAEGKEFYEYCLNERSFHFVDGPAVNAMLVNLLRDYSVAQCYYFIWRAAQMGSDYKVRNKVHSRHAANYISGACQREADKARLQGWDVKSFRRNFNLPRSMLSYVLYDVMLKIGNQGFTEPIGNI
jgi:hypothetical protein